MSDPDFRPCRHQRPTGGELHRHCFAPMPACVIRAAVEVGPDDCAACPIPRAEAELRERILAKLNDESDLMPHSVTPYLPTARAAKIVEGELP